MEADGPIGLKQKKIFIIGGSGSLGNKLIETYLQDNILICYSRDECKHWEMSLRYKSPNLRFIIGDIRDHNRLEISLLREDPHIVIITAALKHVDRCEYATNECILTDLIGPQNVVNIVERHRAILPSFETVCFVSTDKACNPVSVYGMCKALAETLLTEKSYYMKDVKFVSVRYGNVLNSRGSIIPILHQLGRDSSVDAFPLTDERMTRFILPLDDCVRLIEHAILKAESGDIVIAKSVAIRIRDLVSIFSDLYGKPIRITGHRAGEKVDESLVNETQAERLVDDGAYLHIKPCYRGHVSMNDAHEYNSASAPITKEHLRALLLSLSLIQDPPLPSRPCAVDQ